MFHELMIFIIEKLKPPEVVMIENLSLAIDFAY